MSGFGNFAKNEKKKRKKNQMSSSQATSSAPIFTLPKKIEKKRKESN